MQAEQEGETIVEAQASDAFYVSRSPLRQHRATGHHGIASCQELYVERFVNVRQAMLQQSEFV